MSEDWQQRRRDAVAEQAARLERARDGETARARALVAEFVEAARARGLPTEELRARSGEATFPTGLRGWALRRNRSAAVGEDGAFYLLVVPGLTLRERLRARARGLRLAPSDPPLVLGRGGRDGESVPLADLLARRLDGAGDP